MNASPYPYPDTSEAPQLPNLSQKEWYLNRDNLPPPEIGFRLDILNFANEEQGRAPYPETDKFPVQHGKPSIPSGGVKTLSVPSTTLLTDYGDYDNTGSNAEDNAPSSPNKRSITIPYKVNEDLNFLPQNVVKIRERRHKPAVDGSENRSGTPSAHHPPRAPKETKGNPRDRFRSAIYQCNG